MIDINDINDAPWDRHDWTGNLISVDGCSAHDFVADDIEEVIAYGSTDSRDWDGRTVGIVRLKDGRFVAWESWWGPTGSGFCNDAYGGDADIAFASTEESARRHLSERARELIQ